MNIKLLRPADFNSKLRERGVDKKVTVQKICKVCKNEKDVRDALNKIWKEPKKAKAVIDHVFGQNQIIFEFENEISQ